MHRPVRSTLTFVSLLSLLGGCAAIGGDGGGGGPDGRDCSGGKCDSATPERDVNRFVHRWAIDLAKVRQQTPNYSDRVVAASQEQLGMPDALWQAACERERIIDADGRPAGNGGCYAWGNMMRVNYDHTMHDDASTVLVNLMDDLDRDGRPELIDPPGYLNIIALKNADRTEQDEIHGYLQNGDILVYFHPEDSDTTQFTMHHAAMYYDTHEFPGAGRGPVALSLGEQRFVHHVDNPVSYGPAFNAGVRSVPFHVYRFHPNGAAGTPGRDSEGRYEFRCTEATDDELCNGGGTFTITDEMARLYAYQARNWALVNNGRAPFASFHFMSWLDDWKRNHDTATGAEMPGRVPFLSDVDRFAAPLTGGQTPQVYCAGLVFTNLNLAMNRPMNEQGLGEALFRGSRGQTYAFDDNYMSASFRIEDLEVEGLRTLGQNLFEPVPASAIIDAWLEGYFGHFDTTFTQMATAAKSGSPEATAQLNAFMMQLHVPNALATALEPAQLGAVMGRAARAGILDGAAEDISRGFSQLRNQAAKDGAGREQQTVVATPERVRAYARAYASGTQDQFTIRIESHELMVTPGPDGQPDLPQMKAIELQYVENRYVPPPMFHWMANRPDSLLSYVGTVIHADLLTCLPGAECDAGGGDVAEFAEGGPDTSLYPHFYVPNMGRTVQRLIDVNAGPEHIGPGTEIRTRLTASDAEDVRIVLHPAGTFPAVDRYLCDDRAKTRRERRVLDVDCIPLNTPGVPLSLGDRRGPIDDQTIGWALFSPVEAGGAGCRIEEDGKRTCPAIDWTTLQPSATERFEIGAAHGQWALTVLDTGRNSAGSDIRNCASCPSGGAHTNQWYVRVRNDAPAPPAPPALRPGQNWTGAVAHEERLTRELVLPEGLGRATVRLQTREGDADLTVRRGDEQLGNSQRGGTEEDAVAIEMPAAGSYTIEVYGYAASRFELIVDVQNVEVGPMPVDPLQRVLNEYTFEELVDRAGIAPQPARLIVRGRTEALPLDGGGNRAAGPWADVADIVRVSGIGDGTARSVTQHATTLAAGGGAAGG